MDIVNYIAENPNIFLIIMGIVSLFVGSFLNVVIYRLPVMMERNWSEECRIYLGLKAHTDEEKLNLCLPLSHCRRCKKTLKPWHNIPVLSYIFLGAKCAYCKTSISARYPFVETLTCMLSLYVCWRFGFSWQCLAALLFTWFCISLTFIDLDHHFLPDQLTLLLMWLGLFFSMFNLFCSPQDAIIGGMAGYAIFAVTQLFFGLVTGKVGMGQGDYKFLAAIGAYLGWQMLPIVILLASISGIIFAVMQMTVKHSYKSVPLPFGPYLAVAGWIAMLWGSEIMHLYLKVLH